MGVAERISLLENDATHNYNRTQREGVVRWMSRWLLGVDRAIVEPNIVLLSAEEARGTPDGQVMRLEGARSTYDFNRDLEKDLATRRKRLWSTMPLSNRLAEVRRLTGVRPLAELPEPTLELRDAGDRGGFRVEKALVTVEDGLYLSGLAFYPQGEPVGNVVLYIHESGKGTDAGPGGPIERLAQAGHVVAAVDVRGTGETQAKGGWGGDLFGPDARDALTAYLLGRSYVGMRAEDILVCARAIRERSYGPVDLVAVGHVCVPALHAAVLEPELFGSVRLVGGLISWADVVERGQSRGQLANVIHGALAEYDLPDLARILGDRLTIEQPVNALGQ
jgi:hypothetical protein